MLSNSAYRGYKSRESLARSYHVLAASQTSFLVTTDKGAEFLVSLPARALGELLGSCSYKKYQDYLAPCSHAISCILQIGQDPYEYFFMYYGWETSNLIYEQSIKLVTIQGLKILRNEADQEVLPPIKRAKRGRPKWLEFGLLTKRINVYIYAQCVVKVATIDGFALISL